MIKYMFPAFSSAAKIFIPPPIKPNKIDITANIIVIFFIAFSDFHCFNDTIVITYSNGCLPKVNVKRIPNIPRKEY